MSIVIAVFPSTDKIVRKVVQDPYIAVIEIEVEKKSLSKVCLVVFKVVVAIFINFNFLNRPKDVGTFYALFEADVCAVFDVVVLQGVHKTIHYKLFLVHSVFETAILYVVIDVSDNSVSLFVPFITDFELYTICNIYNLDRLSIHENFSNLKVIKISDFYSNAVHFIHDI